MEENYFSINKASWNNRVDTHLESEFYDVPAFLQGKSSLNEIELNLLGDVSGKSILHLQCHFGQDSISLSRLGSQVTAVDISDKAIDAANKLAAETQQNVKFICANIYDLPKYEQNQFDIVFTSYGVIGWLPDLQKWAALIAQYVKPDGKFIMAEFHPVVWMFDDDFNKVAYNYFNTGAIIENEMGTYAKPDAPISQQYVMWNHGIGEVLENLLQHNFQLSSFQEFDYSPYNCFRHTIEVAPNKFQIESIGKKIPMVYALSATKK